MIFTEANIKKYNLVLTKSGNFRCIRNNKIYYYFYACDVCGYPYLNQRKSSKYCTKRCAQTGENNNMFGKGYLIIGKLNPTWNGGYRTNNIPLYDTYAPQLEPIEKCVRDPEDPNILNVFCAHCKKQYRPTIDAVSYRKYGINRNDVGKFYCTDNCKQVCSLFNQSAQQLMERDGENAGRITKLNHEHIRINQTENKNRRFRENGGICDWCETPVTLRTSILHHEVPVAVNFLMADDPDNHWLFCKACNKKAHQLVSCNYYELRLRRVCHT